MQVFNIKTSAKECTGFILTGVRMGQEPYALTIRDFDAGKTESIHANNECIFETALKEAVAQIMQDADWRNGLRKRMTAENRR